jgi:hypothetical protein
MAKLLHLSRPSRRVRDVVRTWWAMRCQKRRRRAQGGQAETPLPLLVHHAYGGLPGGPLCDEIHLADNPGALVSDRIEIRVLDPAIETIEGYPPTEADWLAAGLEFVSYSEARGSWYYENAAVGENKTDGDYAWIRGRFVREGYTPGPWSVVDPNSGAGMPTWSY